MNLATKPVNAATVVRKVLKYIPSQYLEKEYYYFNLTCGFHVISNKNRYIYFGAGCATWLAGSQFPSPWIESGPCSQSPES